jgi:hypothetical protein
MKRLFNEYEAMTETGQKVHDQIRDAVKSVFEDAQENGYSLRDVCQIAEGAVCGLTAEMVLMAAVKKHKKLQVGRLSGS